MDVAVTGNEMVITTACNYYDMKIVANVAPNMVSWELLVGQVVYMKHTTEVTGLTDIMQNSFQTSLKMNLKLHENSYLYKVLYFISPSYACFKDMTAYYQLNVVDLMTGKVDAKLSFLKDSVEIGHVAVSTNGEYKLNIFCPLLTKEILNIPDMDHIEIKMDYAVTGTEIALTTAFNYRDMRIVAK